MRTKEEIVNVINKLTDKKKLSPLHRVCKKDYWIENWISWMCKKYEKILK